MSNLRRSIKLLVLAGVLGTIAPKQTRGQIAKVAPTEEDGPTLFSAAENGFKRYEKPNHTSFEVPSAWVRTMEEDPQRDVHHRAVTFSAPGTRLAAEGRGTYETSITFGVFNLGDSPAFAEDRFLKGLKSTNPKMQFTSNWDTAKISAYQSTVPEVYVISYVNQSDSAERSIGLVALQRAGLSYFWWVMESPESKSAQFRPVFSHVVNSIRYKQ